MTFNSWCSGLARDMIYAEGAKAAIFFITFVFIASFIMANVLIALLVDEFMNSEFEYEPVDPEGDLNSLLEKQHRELIKIILEGQPDKSGNKHTGLAEISEHISKMRDVTDKVESSKMQVDEDERAGVISEKNCSNPEDARDDSSSSNCDVSSKPNITPDRQIEWQTLSSCGAKHGENDTPSKLRKTESNRESSKTPGRNPNFSHSNSDTLENEQPEEHHSTRKPERNVRYGDINLIQRITKMDHDICAIAETLKLICEKLGLETPANSVGLQGIRELNKKERCKKEGDHCSQPSNSLMVINRGKKNS